LYGPDPLDGTQRPRAKSGAGAVGDAKIHRHADERDVELAELLGLDNERPVRRSQQGRHAGIGFGACAARAEDAVRHLAPLGVDHLAGVRRAVLAAKPFESLRIHAHSLPSPRPILP